MRWVSLLLATVSAAALGAMVRLQTRLYARQPAQGLVEYGLILVLIMVVCVAILSTVGKTVSDVWYTKLIPAF